jgi:hypothetical protein
MVAPWPRLKGHGGGVRLPRGVLLGAAGAGALLLLGVIIITITHKDGSKTRIEVPDDAKVEITREPGKGREVKVTQEPGPSRSEAKHAADAPVPAVAAEVEVKLPGTWPLGPTEAVRSGLVPPPPRRSR